MEKTPKIFISYSWSSKNHEDKVINFAERLVSDGVDVSIDKWDLKEGHDKYSFMETMVKSEDIDKVLIILDEKYAEKAEKRTGGVGAETQIISPKIYSDVSQEKFIPIVFEKDDNGNPFLPTFLESRIYIDLSESEKFEENYDSLLRNIYKRPAYRKPKLGKAPSHLFEDTPITHETSFILRGFDAQINKNPKRTTALIRDFLDKFYENLKDFSVIFTSKDDNKIIGKDICDNINSYTPLRNDFIYFFDKVVKSEADFNIDIDVIIRFLEKLPLLTYPQDKRSSWSSYEFENYNFFIHELFLYLIAVGIKNENYKFVEELLYSSYFLQDNYGYKNEPVQFEKFYHYIDIIDRYYNDAYSKTFLSPMADLMIKRIPEGFTIDNLVDSDLTCYYVAVIKGHYWFPLTYIYRRRSQFELFNRLVSCRHFEKVKILFNVETIDELKNKLKEIESKDKTPNAMRYSGSFESVAPIYQIIDIEKIGTVR